MEFTTNVEEFWHGDAPLWRRKPCFTKSLQAPSVDQGLEPDKPFENCDEADRDADPDRKIANAAECTLHFPHSGRSVRTLASHGIRPPCPKVIPIRCHATDTNVYPQQTYEA